MADTLPSLKLTSDGAMKLLNTAMAKAKEMGVPQCISIVDSGGHLLAFGRMDGAFSQSIDTSLMKAMTPASYGTPTADHTTARRSRPTMTRATRAAPVRAAARHHGRDNRRLRPAP